MQTREQQNVSPLYAWYVISILFLAYVVSFIDRQILALMVEPLKADLGLSDTEISLLHGLAFAIFYTTMGIPMGRLADLRNRRNIIAIGVTVWCLMTAACALARNFWQLFLGRIGVGVGEAALLPAAYSMIADYFPREKRGLAMGLFASGAFVGAGLAYLVGGFVVHFAIGNENVTLPLIGALRPWQATFIIVGLPGLMVAALMLTVREPKRMDMVDASQASHNMTFKETLVHIAERRFAYLSVLFGIAMLASLTYGCFAWVPSHFIRNFGWTVADVGTAFGFTVLFAGTAGVWSAGYLADYLLRRGHKDTYHIVGIISAIGALVPTIVAPLMSDAQWAMGLYVVSFYFQGMPIGLGPAAVSAIVANRARGQAIALYSFVIAFLGLAFGPAAIAFATDHIFGSPEDVRYSLVLYALITLPLAIIILGLGRRPYRNAVFH